MSTRRLALVPLAAALSVAACTAAPEAPIAAPAPPTAAAPAPTDAVGWMDRFCGALIPVLAASTPTRTDPADPKEALDELTTLNSAAGSAVAELDRLGLPPTEHGERLILRVRPQLTALQTSTADARTAAEGGSGATYTVGTRNGILEYLQRTNFGPLPAEDPELSAAAAGAANCAKAKFAPTT